MNGLSFQERQQQQEVLHGVDQVVEQESHLNCAIHLLDDRLNSVKQTTPGTMYEIAELMNPDYVHDRAFRVMFLRANEYDPEASADHMIRFFDMKNELFGIDKLSKDITLEDLDQDDMDCLKAGWFQLCDRDRSGRPVIALFAGLMPSFSIQSWLRVQYFVKMRALRSEQTQLRGTVSIWYGLGRFGNKAGNTGYADSYKAARALPLKKAATHICVDEMHQALLANVLVKLMKNNMRARLRVHFGSQMECQYQLSTYGILPHTLRLDPNGSMILTRNLQWIEDCAIEDHLSSLQGAPIVLETRGNIPGPIDISYNETSVQAAPIVLETQSNIPGPNDVLFSGGKITKHAGTLAFRQMIKDYSAVYDSGTDATKRQIAENLLERVHESGGRFLKQSKNSTSWEDVPPKELRKKIMQSFRNRRKLNTSSSVTTVPGTLIQGGPQHNDVLFGRTQRTQGTKTLQVLIENHFEQYASLWIAE